MINGAFISSYSPPDEEGGIWQRGNIKYLFGAKVYRINTKLSMMRIASK